MRVFRTLAAILSLSLVCWHLSAQTNNRIVKGLVQNENGQVIDGVQVNAETGELFTPNNDGSFEIRVPFQCRKLTFSAPYYIETSMEIDGSFLYVRLKYDKAAEEKVRKEAEAKAKAEADAKAKAEKERIAAEERVRKEAEAKAKAEQKEQRKKAILEKEKEYNSRFTNKGFEHTLSLSYAYSFSSVQLTYRYSGIQSYGALHPLELDYTLSYKFNRLFSIGAGIGVLYNLKSIRILGDVLVGESSSLRQRRLDVPAYLSLKLRPGRNTIRPYLEAQAGYYFLSSCFTTGASIGMEYRLAKREALQCGAFFKFVPYPGTSQYSPKPAAGLTIGFNL